MRGKMEREKQEAVLEAVLFTMGESVELTKLAEVIEEDKETTRAILYKMKDKLALSDRGIDLIELEDSFQLCTKTELYEYLIKIAKNPRKYVLTDACLETLSIIAYKQPITRSEIEKVRGVSCDHAINRLIEFELVTELGRMDAPGRPLLFGTTEEFLRRFGIHSLEALPKLNPIQVEEFKEQAEQEIELQLGV
ncbi:MAG: SMC-Scp complex subunit ScpB [Lachnospiraceae bacterium]|nr:SMC-Scp complex subunit ScpB [Lachnospiraceae bacterium]MCI7595494.1 SMC-Scp complex subunit ScpB [Lachnospiraceae bacterium]MDD7050299.1 SMC-Scp complex subunit ScpB [Lachnospiraceae bacterium]MDY3223353.1 SMC-Scp complex subunit ScpB [Lachnospiraceae bacterium]MDY4097989.1 SMC-Scp complex subunit ScpB [Lachnospiraceae bacterium]